MQVRPTTGSDYTTGGMDPAAAGFVLTHSMRPTSSRGSSRRSSLNSWANDNSDDAALSALQNDRRLQLLKLQAFSRNGYSLQSAASDAVAGVLRSTTRDYAVIGGKAASALIQRFHTRAPLTNENKALSFSTVDWDIKVCKPDFEHLAVAITDAVTRETGLSLTHHIFQASGTEIHLFGYIDHGPLVSLIDLHVVGKLPPRVEVDGIKYANLQWIIDELVRTMAEHSDASQVMKYLKRQRRLQLLRQITPNRVARELEGKR